MRPVGSVLLDGFFQYTRPAFCRFEKGASFCSYKFETKKGKTESVASLPFGSMQLD